VEEEEEKSGRKMFVLWERGHEARKGMTSSLKERKAVGEQSKEGQHNIREERRRIQCSAR
jgi:hypothetical protein